MEESLSRTKVCALSQNKVIILGGYGGSGVPSRHVQIFDYQSISSYSIYQTNQLPYTGNYSYFPCVKNSSSVFLFRSVNEF